MRAMMLTMAWLIAALPAFAGPPATLCAGDCDGDGRVIVAELVTGVRIALAADAIGRCRTLDGDASDTVSVSELVKATGNLLSGCPSPLVLSRLSGTFDVTLYAPDGAASDALGWVETDADDSVALTVVLSADRMLHLSGGVASDGAIVLDGQRLGNDGGTAANGSAVARVAEGRVAINGGVVIQEGDGEVSSMVFTMRRPEAGAPPLSRRYVVRLEYEEPYGGARMSLTVTATADGVGSTSGALLLGSDGSDAGEVFPGSCRVTASGRVYLTATNRFIGQLDPPYPFTLVGYFPRADDDIGGGLLATDWPQGLVHGAWSATIMSGAE